MTRVRTVRWPALVLALAMSAAACTTADPDTAETTTAASGESTTTQEGSETTARSDFRLAYTVRFFAASLLVLPPLLSVLTLGYVGSLIVHSAGGFISFAGDGLYVEEREYARDDKTVYLVGMVHMAERSFYEDVFAGFPSHNAVILAEGVSDDSGLLTGDLSGRDELAERAGLCTWVVTSNPSFFQNSRTGSISST